MRTFILLSFYPSESAVTLIDNKQPTSTTTKNRKIRRRNSILKQLVVDRSPILKAIPSYLFQIFVVFWHFYRAIGSKNYVFTIKKSLFTISIQSINPDHQLKLLFENWIKKMKFVPARQGDEIIKQQHQKMAARGIKRNDVNAVLSTTHYVTVRSIIVLVHTVLSWQIWHIFGSQWWQINWCWLRCLTLWSTHIKTISCKEIWKIPLNQFHKIFKILG